MENKRTSWNKGKTLSLAHRHALSIAANTRVARGLLPPSRRGVSFTPEQRARRSALMSGPNHPQWKGGVSSNPNYFRDHARRWAAANPERAQHNKHLRRIRERGAAGTHTALEWAELKRMFENSCVRCHRSDPEMILTKDHIFPLIYGGTDYISNIQPLCRSCNSSKNARMVDFRPLFVILKTI